MRFQKLVVPGLLWLLFLTANAQNAPSKALGPARGQTPMLELGGNYTFLHANAPPAQCGCFSMSGGGGTIALNAAHGFSFVADLSGGHSNNVDGTAQNISLSYYLFGPRLSYRTARRVTPYVETLAGLSKESSNYAYVNHASALGVMAGGGVSMPLSRVIGWDFEADYVYTQLPNNANNEQNMLRLSTGILFRFGAR